MRLKNWRSCPEELLITPRRFQSSSLDLVSVNLLIAEYSSRPQLIVGGAKQLHI
jgi:hypothetical protein